MKEKKMFVVFIFIALLCNTCMKDDNQIPDDEGIQNEALSDEDVAFLDNLETVELSANEIVLPGGQTVDEYLLQYDPDFYNEIHSKNALKSNLAEPKMTADLLLAKLNAVAVMLTDRSKFVYPEGQVIGQPAQNGLAYSFGSKQYTERTRPPEGECTDEVFGLDCSGFIYQLFYQSGVTRGLWTTAEVQRRPDTLKKYIQVAFTDFTNLKIENLGKIPSTEFLSGDIIYWLKKNGKARHIGMVVKDSLGNSYIAQSNGTGKSSSDCTKNYGPTRGPRFFNLSAALASSNFGDNYGIVRIEAEKKLDFNTCYFDLAVGGQYNYIAIDTSYTLGTDILLGAVYTGSFSGNTFNATYSEAGGPETTITGSIKAVIDDNQTKIESFDWSEQWINTTSTISKACKAQNITLYSSDDASILFFIGGLNITDHIITLNDEQTSNGLNYTIDDFWGEEDSYIYVEFYSD